MPAPDRGSSASVAALDLRPPASVRVPTERLDRLLASVGEVVLAKSQLRESARDEGPDRSPRGPDALDRMDRVLGVLERRARDLRTAPLLRIVEKLPRLARELGLALGRRVALELSGVELELDRGILDRLADPLVHLVRNAVAHGVEAPAVRRRAGKPEEGVIRIDARREREAIEISVSDDGAGVDTGALRDRAVALGVLPADVAEDLGAGDLARLAFRAGLSTASAVSEVAGRGVGLDAVRATVQALGGSVDLLSEPGRGTTVVLSVPLSAAVQRVILLGVGTERVAIAIARVDRIDEVDARHVERAGRETFVLVDGVPLPLLELGALLGLSTEPCGERTLVVLVEIHGQRTALRIDRLLGQADVFVKPLPPLLSGLRAVSGYSLDAEGRPVFLVEPSQLL